ncbi:MAG: hypothetical protein JWO62_3271 [Acidimicrobiaceae bacterium]|jgi:hypothetical protein|nr:hypothetical protein [Acidimicrobiaceae bacterium]
MKIGTAIFLLALGAIIRFAVYTTVHGIALNAVGIILMIAGALGLILSLTVWGSQTSRTHRRTVVDNGVGNASVRDETVTVDGSSPKS